MNRHRVACTSLIALILGAVGVPTGAQDEAPPEFVMGVNGHPFVQEGYWQVPLDTQLDLITELGVGWYRSDWGWGLDFTHSDRLVEAAQARGIKLLPVLFPRVEAAGDDLRETRRLAHEYGKAIAERYRGRITHYELSNELDCRCMTRWPNGGDRDGASRGDYDFHLYAQQAELIRGLAEGVREGDPDAVRVVDTAGWLHFGFMDRLIDDGVPFEIVAWHWYSDMGDITETKGSYSGTWDVLAKLKSWGKPVWITEMNRRNGDMDGAGEDQAAYLTDQVRKLRASGIVTGFFEYELLDEPYFEGGEAHYGLVTLEKVDGAWQVGQRKPAFEAMRELATEP